ncbi:unnamed protein product [Effrenium voratum]|nr:unnamed protein product [Effrenium voratum]
MAAHLRALDATEQLHARKVASLLNSQNRLRCENAALKREDVARRASGRGAALARAEQELLQQDAILRAFYNFLGKDTARKQILRALEAGPKRIRPTTREELRWRLEDARAELSELRAQKAKSEAVEQPSKPREGGEVEAELAAQRRAIEEWKQRIAKQEQSNAGHQVEIVSLERALQSGLERLDAPARSAAARPPWQLLACQAPEPDVQALKERLRSQDKALSALREERVRSEEQLMASQRKTQELSQESSTTGGGSYSACAPVAATPRGRLASSSRARFCRCRRTCRRGSWPLRRCRLAANPSVQTRRAPFWMDSAASRCCSRTWRDKSSGAWRS